MSDAPPVTPAFRGRLEAFIARRIALGFGRQDHLGLGIAVAILGLALGVGVLLVTLSVLNGFERELRERVLALLPHVSVYTNGAVEVDDRLEALLENHPLVESYASFMQGTIVLSVPGRTLSSRITGLSPSGIEEATIVGRFLEAGGALPEAPYEILIGSQAAERLGVSVGDLVNVTLPTVIATPLGVFPRAKRFRISGIFATATQIDLSNTFARLADLERLFSRQPVYRGWRAQGSALFSADEIIADQIAAELKEAGGERVSTVTWRQTHGGLYEAIATQKTIMALLLFMVIAVAAFNVVSNLRILVSRKEADIAILITLGANQRMIAGIFFSLAAFIGLTGITIGLSLGAVFALALDDLYAWFESVSESRLMARYFVRHLPVQISAADAALIALISGALCLAAAVLPARRAARVLPIDTLRNE